MNILVVATSLSSMLYRPLANLFTCSAIKLWFSEDVVTSSVEAAVSSIILLIVITELIVFVFTSSILDIILFNSIIFL